MNRVEKIMAQHRFGMFLHWGVYSLSEEHEQYQMRYGIPRREYERLATRFNPRMFDAEAIVLEAKKAGMSYLVLTAKHHDGFCMWDTAETDFNVMHTPYGKDIVRQFAEACKVHGIAFGLYYSIPDWHHPNAYNSLSSHQIRPEEGDTPDSVLYREFVKRQLRELLSNYGPIYCLFWDIPPRIDDPSLNELARSLQPDILINDRGYSKGDYSTPERSVPDERAFCFPTEACQSLDRAAWGYRKNAEFYHVSVIERSMDAILAMGGNYLLNLGPKPDGTFDERALARLRIIGKWYCRVKEGIEGCVPCSAAFRDRDFLMQTDGNSLYIHSYAAKSESLNLYPLRTMPIRITDLSTGDEIFADCRTCPRDFKGYEPCKECYVHIDGLKERAEPYVLKMEFSSAVREQVFSSLSEIGSLKDEIL